MTEDEVRRIEALLAVSLPLEYREFPHVDVADRDGVIAYFLSVSPVAARPQHERDELRETLRRLISDGEYRLHLRAEVWLTRRV